MQAALLKDLIEKGYSVRAIGKELGCSFTNVRYWLKRHNLNIVSYSARIVTQPCTATYFN